MGMTEWDHLKKKCCDMHLKIKLILSPTEPTIVVST